MRKIIAVFLLLGMLLLCGCQKTPEEPIVIGKVNDGWKEAELPEEEKNDLELPETYEKELQFKDLTVSISAEIDVSGEQVYPVYVLEQAVFTQETADRVMDLLIGEAELFQVRNDRTKQVIQQEIDHYARELNYDGCTEEQAQLYQQMLKELIEEKEKAPEERSVAAASREIGYVESQHIAYKFGYEMKTKDGGTMYVMTDSARKKAEQEGYVGINGRCTLENGKEMVFMLQNIPKGTSRIRYGIPDNVQDPLNAGEISEADALETANSMMERLGIEYEYLGSENVVEGKDYYRFNYRSTFSELKQLQGAVIDPAPIVGDSKEYNIPVVQESIEIFVNADGIYGFDWYAPTKLVKREQENIELLPWNEASAIIEKGLEIRNIWSSEEEDVIARRLEVDKIVLSYTNVRKDSDFTSTYYVPVWDVIGTMTYIYKEDYDPEAVEGGGYILDVNNERIAYENCSVLTVNAIDGTFIDRGMGY